MISYSFSEARQKLSSVLDKARTEGEVLIKRKDGSVFIVKPATTVGSPLNVAGVDLDISAKEIVEIVREMRER